MMNGDKWKIFKIIYLLFDGFNVTIPVKKIALESLEISLGQNQNEQ